MYIAQGKLAETAAIMDTPLPVGAGYSSELLRELVRGIWLLGHNLRDAAYKCALKLVERAESTGFLIYAQEGKRFAALTANPPSLADISRLVCCPIDEY